MARETIGPQRRFIILQRDSFTCLFCNARPGNDRLQVDHFIPHSKRGSDHDNNLGTTCDRCNNGKSNRIAIPMSLCTNENDDAGWVIWKRWGSWVLSWNPNPSTEENDNPLIDHTCAIALTHEPTRYWFDLFRVHEDDWHEHLERKIWMREDDEIAQIDAHYESQPRRPFFTTLEDLTNRDIHPLERHPARGRRWQDFCSAIEFSRTLVRRH